MKVESPDEMTAPRLERVQYYLERRLGKEDRATHISRRQGIRGKIFQYGTPPIEHHSMLDFIQGMTSSDVPPQTDEPIYHTKLNTSIYEETVGLLVTPPGDYSQTTVVADILRARCGFTEHQMYKFINGITESQLRAWEQVIERSRIPLMCSWTEAQVLFEIFLATGKKPTSLAEAAVAHFDPADVGNQYKDHPTIEGETWLLDAQIPNKADASNFHCLEVELRPAGIFGDGRPVYRLNHNNNTYRRTMQEALDHYKYSIDYCNGQGASQGVKILKPELLS